MRTNCFKSEFYRLTALAAAAVVASHVAIADDSSVSKSAGPDGSKVATASGSGISDSSSSSDNSKSTDSSKNSDGSSKSSSGSSDDGKSSSSTPVIKDGTVSGKTVSDGLATAANSGTVAPVQSKADPMGLSIIGPTRLAGSDAASANFDKTLPNVTQFIIKTLPESQNNSAVVKAMPLDPKKLVLANTENVRAYFVYEGAGFVNTLGVNTTGNGVSQGNPQLIFPAIRSSTSAFASAPAGTRTAQDPLLPGDFVNLGVMQAGTKLDFFLIANGANGGNTVWNTSGINPDGINHVAALSERMFAIPNMNSPYLYISFEDLWGGGDHDYNDAIIAVNVGAATINRLVATPEPATWASLASFLGLAVYVKRRQDRHNKAHSGAAA